MLCFFKGEGQEVRKITYKQLREEVRKCAAALRAAGIQVGDRVVGKEFFHSNLFFGFQFHFNFHFIQKNSNFKN